MGSTRASGSFFGGGMPVSSAIDVVDEEKQLIDKIFEIVDKDHSGSIDVGELQQMFTIFNVDSKYLDTAINRIMSGVDKDFDGQISPDEFYKMLSRKFEKGDSRKDIDTAFRRFDKNRDDKLDVEELHQVAQMLGENLKREEIKDMIFTFKKMYRTNGPGKEAVADKTLKGEKPKDRNAKKFGEEDEHLTLTPDEFYFIMQQEL